MVIGYGSSDIAVMFRARGTKLAGALTPEIVATGHPVTGHVSGTPVEITGYVLALDAPVSTEHNSSAAGGMPQVAAAL